MTQRRSRPSKQEILDNRQAVWPENSLCPLCGREMVPGPSLNEHHLTPRMYGGAKKFVIHRVCHSKIHSVFTERELAQEYNSFENLRAHPEMKSFIKWVRKQNPEFIDKHVRPAR